MTITRINDNKDFTSSITNNDFIFVTIQPVCHSDRIPLFFSPDSRENPFFQSGDSGIRQKAAKL